jgi:PAS domain-containing protein
MNNELAAATDDHGKEVIALERKLHEIQQRIEELRGGEVNAVVSPGGQLYWLDLLGKAREDLRVSESSLRASRDDFHTLAEALPQIVWRTGPDGLTDYQSTMGRLHRTYP